MNYNRGTPHFHPTDQQLFDHCLNQIKMNTKGSLNNAKSILNFLITKENNNERYYYTLGLVYIMLGENDEALIKFNHTLQIIFSKQTIYSTQECNSKNILEILTFQNQRNQNLDHLKEVLFNVYLNQGIIYLNKALYNQANDSFTNAINTKPISSIAYNYRGQIYTQALSTEYDERFYIQAKSDFERAIALDPNFIEAQDHLKKLKELLAPSSPLTPIEQNFEHHYSEYLMDLSPLSPLPKNLHRNSPPKNNTPLSNETNKGSKIKSLSQSMEEMYIDEQTPSLDAPKQSNAKHPKSNLYIETFIDPNSSPSTTRIVISPRNLHYQRVPFNTPIDQGTSQENFGFPPNIDSPHHNSQFDQTVFENTLKQSPRTDLKNFNQQHLQYQQSMVEPITSKTSSLTISKYIPSIEKVITNQSFTSNHIQSQQSPRANFTTQFNSTSQPAQEFTFISETGKSSKRGEYFNQYIPDNNRKPLHRSLPSKYGTVQVPFTSKNSPRKNNLDSSSNFEK